MSYARESWTIKLKVPMSKQVASDDKLMEALDEFCINGRVHWLEGDSIIPTYTFNVEYFGQVRAKLAALQVLLCDKRVERVSVNVKQEVGATRGCLLDLLRQIEDIEGSL